jgi:hypothetical protein
MTIDNFNGFSGVVADKKGEQRRCVSVDGARKPLALCENRTLGRLGNEESPGMAGRFSSRPAVSLAAEIEADYRAPIPSGRR